MKNRVLSFTALGFLLAALFVAALPARAADVDKRIQALEDELVRLKAEQAQVKTEQIEMRKEASAAAAALPTFSYRPGGGMTIQAADKAWSLNLAHEVHYVMPFSSGRDNQGRTSGEVMGRRFRQFWTLCVNNCFWEIESRLDLDGFGTNSDLQRGVGWMHLEQISPWLPTFYLGMDGPSSISSYRRGSSSTGAQAEYDLLSRNGGFNTGRFGTGVGVNWDNKDLSAIGIPGRLVRFNTVMASIGEADDGNSVRSDRKDYNAYINIEPFSKLNNMWLKGLGLEFGAWFCNNDPHASANACGRLRIRDHGPAGRTTLFDTRLRIRERHRLRFDGAGNHTTINNADVTTTVNIGGGPALFFMPGVQWQMGPYTLRATGGWQSYRDRSQTFEGGLNKIGTTDSVFESITVGSRRIKGRNWNIGHDLFLWSPKGFLTGSSSTPGSILIGTHFERTDVSCTVPRVTMVRADGFGTDDITLPNCADVRLSNRRTDTFGASAGTAFDTSFDNPGMNRNRILLREFDIYYFIAPRASIGLNFLWYDASNIPAGTDSSPGSQFNLNKSGQGKEVAGKGGEWMDILLNLRWSF